MISVKSLFDCYAPGDCMHRFLFWSFLQRIKHPIPYPVKKHLLALFFINIAVTATAQSYMGYFHDNYAGVQSVLFNPAMIADSRFKTDINLFSVSAFAGNDLYGVRLFDVYKKGYDFDKEAKVTTRATNNAIGNVDIMGPSFMFNIAPKHTVALFTRARSIMNVGRVNGNLVDDVKDGLDVAQSFKFNGNSPNGVGHAWGEVGLSYATVLMQQRQHFLKGGLTVKYLQGGANAYVQGRDIGLTLVRNTIDPKLGSVISNGEVTIGGSHDFEANQDLEFDINSAGVGFDFGLVYEWRPDYEDYDLRYARPLDNGFREFNKYKLRFGLSVTDIGGIHYRKSRQDTYNLNGVVTVDMIDNVDDIYDFLNANYNRITTTKGVRANLPTALHAEVDWNIANKYYLNLNSDISMVAANKLNGSSIANRLSLTPRYESRWFSFYVPVSWMEYSGMQVGSGLRVGTFFIGSGSVLTNLLSKQSRAADFYIGIKIPVYQKELKETCRPCYFR